MGELACVILAAGEGRRAGGPKAFCLWRDPVTGVGEPFLARVVSVASRGGCRPILAVIRPADRPRAEALTLPGLLLVENPDPTQGMLSSLRCGVEALPREAEGLLVFPVDHPEVQVRTVRSLVEAFFRDSGSLWAPSWEGRRGHPVVLPVDLARRIPREDLPGGLAAWVRREALSWGEVSVEDPGILRNLNVPESQGG